MITVCRPFQSASERDCLLLCRYGAEYNEGEDWGQNFAAAESASTACLMGRVPAPEEGGVLDRAEGAPPRDRLALISPRPGPRFRTTPRRSAKSSVSASRSPRMAAARLASISPSEVRCCLTPAPLHEPQAIPRSAPAAARRRAASRPALWQQRPARGQQRWPRRSAGPRCRALSLTLMKRSDRMSSEFRSVRLSSPHDPRGDHHADARPAPCRPADALPRPR
jgi:hypothetical protein